MPTFGYELQRDEFVDINNYFDLQLLKKIYKKNILKKIYKKNILKKI